MSKENHDLIVCDPGASGCFLVFSEGTYKSLNMPKDGDIVVVDTILAFAERHLQPRTTFILEDIPLTTRGHCPESANSKLQRNYALIKGAVLASKLGPSLTLMKPQTWQRKLGIKRVKGMGQQDWKRFLANVARTHYPEQKITLANADAYLMAAAWRLS